MEEQVEKSLKEKPNQREVELTNLVLDLALEKLREAFSGRSFSIVSVRKVAKASQIDRRGQKWEVLRLAHTTGFNGMKRNTLRDLVLTTVRFFGLSREIWKDVPPSRLRRVLASESEGVSWAVGIEGTTKGAQKRTAAKLREVYNFSKRRASKIVKEIKEGKRAIAMEKRNAEKWEEWFEVQEETPGWEKIG
jgi:hypothetical protein